MTARLLARLALVAGSLAAVALLGELTLRVAARDGAVGSSGRAYFAPYRPDPWLGYALRPGWSGVHETPEFRVDVHIDERGHRGPPPTASALTPDATRRRLLVLGDSLAFGFGVAHDALFTRRLEEALRNRGLATEVWNAAVPGYGSDHHLVRLRRDVLSADATTPRPDAVVVVLCENDVDDLAWSRITPDADGLPVATRSTRRLIDHRGRMRYVAENGEQLPDWLEDPPALAQRSKLFQWIRHRVARAWLARAEPPGASRGPTRPTGSVLDPAGMREEALRDALADDPTFRRAYHSRLNDALERSAAEAGLPLFFLHLGPGRSAVADDCAARASCFDLAARLDATERDRLRFAADGHYTAEGHRRIAELIEQQWLATLAASLDASREGG